jgi:hypothetical protein
MLSKVPLREGSNSEINICGSQLDRRGGEHAAAIILQFFCDGYPQSFSSIWRVGRTIR